MDAENRLASLEIRQFDRNPAVKPSRSEQRLVQRLRTVGRRKDDDALLAVESVHLAQQLIQRLLALVVSADARAVALFADGINLVNEYDTRCLLIRLFKQIAYLSRAHANEHLDELRAGDREERDIALARDRFGQQCFAGARRSDQQRALGQRCADVRIFLRIVQKIDDLGQRLLCLILSGDIRKRDAGLRLDIDLGICLAERHRSACAAAHSLHHETPQEEKQQNRNAITHKHHEQEIALRRLDLRERRAGFIQPLYQFGVVHAHRAVYLLCTAASHRALQTTGKIIALGGQCVIRAGLAVLLRPLFFTLEGEVDLVLLDLNFVDVLFVQLFQKRVVADILHSAGQHARHDERIDDQKQHRNNGTVDKNTPFVVILITVRFHKLSLPLKIFPLFTL